MLKEDFKIFPTKIVKRKIIMQKKVYLQEQKP